MKWNMTLLTKLNYLKTMGYYETRWFIMTLFEKWIIYGKLS